MNGMASPCQAPTGTVDLLSGGEATVTPVPTPPEVTKHMAEAARFVQMEEVYRWFIDVYRCLWQKIFKNTVF